MVSHDLECLGCRLYPVIPWKHVLHMCASRSQVTAQLGKTRGEKNKLSGSSWSLRAAGAQTMAPAKGATERSLGSRPLNVIYRSSSPI